MITMMYPVGFTQVVSLVYRKATSLDPRIFYRHLLQATGKHHVYT